MEEKQSYRTYDVWFATWLKMAGVELAGYSVQPGTTKIEFTFLLAPSVWNKARVEFFMSPFSKFRSELRDLKSLAF